MTERKRGGGRGKDWRPSPARGPGNGNPPAPPLQPGHSLRLVHGGASNQLRTRYPEQLAEAERLIAEAVEGLPAGSPAFAIQRAVAVERLVRYQLVRDWLDENGGDVDPKTADSKGAAKFAAQQLAALERTLDALGLSPRSAAALYGDLARAVPLADQLSEARRVREQRLADLDAEGDTA